MQTRFLSFLLLAITLAVPATAQKRASATKEPAFPEAIEQAKKAVESADYAAAVAALQAAIRDVQKKQRAAVLAALPKPEGFTIRDEDEKKDADNPFAAGLVALGMTLTRHYEGKGDKNLEVEVTANSPIVSMMSMMLTNPAIAKADGAEIVEYGAHKALLKAGDGSQELSIVMHGKHLVKVTAHGMTADELFAIFDQAAVDRLEKPLGK